MAYPLDACPPVVLDSDPYSDTLEANAPFQSTDDITVEVPPVADKNAPFVKSVRTNVVLTPDGGIRPVGTKELVGWNGSVEYAERKRMREALQQIHDKAKFTKAATGPIHPDAVKLLGDLTVAATNRLNQIKAIYDKWAARRIASKYGDQTPDGMQDLGLNQAVQDYITFAAPMNAEQRGQVYQTYYFGKPEFLAEVGWNGNIHQMPDNILWSVFAVEQKHDRNTIRQLYREAYKMLWCAEYGVAQSQSYYSNKARHLLGPGGKQAGGGFATPPPPPLPPHIMFVPANIGGLKTGYMPGEGEPIPPPKQPDAQIPIPPPQQLDPDAGLPTEPPPPLPPDADAGEPPPVDADPAPDAGMPPEGADAGDGGFVPVPTSTVPSPWYRTAGGKTAIVVVATALLSAGVYGGYRYLTRPRYV